MKHLEPGNDACDGHLESLVSEFDLHTPHKVYGSSYDSIQTHQIHCRVHGVGSCLVLHPEAISYRH